MAIMESPSPLSERWEPAMSNNILNPLEKELLIRLYRSIPTSSSPTSAAPQRERGGVQDLAQEVRRRGALRAVSLEEDAEPASRGRGRDGGDPAPRAHQDQNRAGATKKRLHPDPERRWDAGRVRACIREECAIIEALSKEFPVTGLCSLCGVSRSGFYKWRKRGGDPPKDRAKVLRLVQGCHDAHPRTGTGGCTPTSRGAMA